jgi:hypothetical protein
VQLINELEDANKEIKELKKKEKERLEEEESIYNRSCSQLLIVLYRSEGSYSKEERSVDSDNRS